MYIERAVAVVALNKALFAYEDETEARFKNDPELDISEWFFHRIFVQNMNGIDRQTILDIPAADVRPVPEGGIGEMSDGYHTFNGLYYQRMILFAALVKVYKGKAWKSWRHEDGELCFGKDNYFIVGIDTPQGSYTYHYHGEYWELFDCEELPTAKHWDGHTEEDVTRLLSLDVRPVVRGKWVMARGSYCTPGGDPVWECSECGKGTHVYGIEHGTYGADVSDGQWVACPNCGADMREADNEKA